MHINPALLVGLILTSAAIAQTNEGKLSSLDLTKLEQAWGEAQRDKSVDGNPLSIAGQRFNTGVGTHADSSLRIALDGQGVSFSAFVGIDDEVDDVRPASVEFKIALDGKTVWKSGVMRATHNAKQVKLDLRGAKLMTLVVTDAGDGINYDHADWADAKIEMIGSANPLAVARVVEKAEILTPKPGPVPKLTGPKVFGVRPTHPILFTISATGDRPMQFSAQGLPQGVQLDMHTGRLTGAIEKRGEFAIKLRAANAKGSAERDFKIIVGDKIALTPPLGWNSWNCFAGAVSDEKIRAAADAFVASGLVNHGWSYINIDDCWQIKPTANPSSDDPDLQGEPRDRKGRIRTNKRFPNMKALADYVHDKGLKIGTYSSPGPLTCAGFVGSYQFEVQDAQQYADWGFDYLKHDWCSYGRIAKDDSVGARKRPYHVMRQALDSVNRDIVYSLCQYGMSDVWEWGDEVGGNCWRTTGDITDTWSSMAGIGFSQAGHEKFAGPGRWNDPDMLVVGHVGWGANTRPTKLSGNEQYTHIALWSLLCSPLLIGCDLTKLDDFTLNLLTNDEVLEVNQDPKGEQAHRVIANEEGAEIWMKQMADGSHTIGLFNRGEAEIEITAKWTELKLAGKQTVRDLWRQKELGAYADAFTTKVPSHGVVLVRVTQK